jgi:hypothetical protein
MIKQLLKSTDISLEGNLLLPQEHNCPVFLVMAVKYLVFWRCDWSHNDIDYRDLETQMGHCPEMHRSMIA